MTEAQIAELEAAGRLFMVNIPVVFLLRIGKEIDSRFDD